ncbi:MAG: hypothetical protein ABI674_06990 [Spartobacteria bacterium]
MKTSCVALFLCLALATALPAKGNEWSGNYTDKKYLNGQAVFQLNILQEGETISVDFDAAYNDGHDCAPEASGTAQAVDKNTLKFNFVDSANNSGTGTIKRAGGEVILSLKTMRVADPRCVVFYKENIRLAPAR